MGKEKIVFENGAIIRVGTKIQFEDWGEIKTDDTFIGQNQTFKVDFEDNINNSLPGTLGEGKNFIVKGCDENEK